MIERKYLNKLVYILNNETFIKNYSSFLLFKNAYTIDNNEDLLELLNLNDISDLLCGSANKKTELKVTHNSILAEYSVVTDESEYFIFTINNDYIVSIYVICGMSIFTYYENVIQLDLESIMLYEKIKRMRGVK